MEMNMLRIIYPNQDSNSFERYEESMERLMDKVNTYKEEWDYGFREELANS
jgi:hypothetical protein